MKKSLILLMAVSALAGPARADDGSNLDLGSQTLGATRPFEGVVTAVDSNGNYPEHCFTAISDDGLAKVFRISSLKDLDVGDRVSLQYVESDVYPQMVKSIRFHSSQSGSEK